MIRFLFLFFIFSLILIKPTNADFADQKIIKNNKLSATTLDFSQLKTTNNSSIENLFNISGILPGGYQVASLRLKNQGKISPVYLLNFQKKSGDDNFCRYLEINFIQDNQSVYQGPLVDLNFNFTPDSKQDFSDFLVFVKLDDKYLSSKAEFCDFNLNITSSNHDSNQKSGFKYQRNIFNNISSN